MARNEYSYRKIGTVMHYQNAAERRRKQNPSKPVPIIRAEFIDRNKYNPRDCRAQGKR